MAQYNFSAEQQDAIFSEGQNLLVAAGAGSGKTSVLVERIIQWLRRGGSMDKMLALTFTNAAAADMRSKIGTALANTLLEEPENDHLRRQSALLPQAGISTIHSFCLELLRRYAYRLGLAPSFRVAGELDTAIMQKEVLDALLEEEYARAGSDLPRLADAYGGSRNDKGLVELVYSVYTYAQSRPDPAAWLQSCAEGFGAKATLDEYPFAAFLEDYLRRSLGYAQVLLQQALQLSLLPEAWQLQLAEEAQTVEAVRLCPCGLEQLLPLLGEISFATLRAPRKKKDSPPELYDEEQMAHCKQLRDAAKEEIRSLQKQYAKKSCAVYRQELADLQELMTALTVLVQRYAEALREEKYRKGLIDFSDMEHLTLELLQQEEIHREMQDRYEVVLIDEYQDINEVQEAILRRIARPHSLFAVGDVKQSIYRFRLAEPTLFLDKYERYGRGEQGRRIDLNRNYRSDRAVIHTVNDVFRQLMSGGSTEIVYDDAAALKPGREDEGDPAEWLLIDMDVQDTGEEKLSGVWAEARLIARRIRVLRQEGYAYRDMAILQRSTRTREPVLLAALAEAGIPAVADHEENYTESPEVMLLISILQLMDNPAQDIPLAAVLRSPIFRFTADDLLRIRLGRQDMPFYEALKDCAAGEDALAEKARYSLRTLQRWRRTAGEKRITELLRQVYRESGFYCMVSAMPDGVRKKANLDQLYAYAHQYECGAYAGLFRFVQLLEEQKTLNVSAQNSKLVAENEDAVRLMSIHKSKGLEFPVVFVAGLASKFNETDERADLVMHRTLGFGARIADRKRRIKYPSLSHTAVVRKLHEEALAEEMRVLYVAFTRPKQRLILTAALSKTESTLQAWADAAVQAGEQLAEHTLLRAHRPMDWLGPVLMRHADADILRQRVLQPVPVLPGQSRCRVEVVAAAELQQPTQTELQPEEADAAPAGLAAVREVLAYRYPYANDCDYPAKWSVSDLNRLDFVEEDLVQPFFFEDAFAALREDDGTQQNKALAAARGTACHKVMELLDLTRTVPEEMVQQIAAMEEEGLIPPNTVNPGMIQAFLQSKVGQALAASDQVLREVPFTMLQQVLPGHDPVMVQGTIDAVFRQDDGWVLLDYKTGGYGKSDDRIREAYAGQIFCYCDAVERMWKQPVKAAYLCMLDLQRNLALPVDTQKTDDWERRNLR